MSDLLERLDEYESFGVHPAVVDEAIEEIKRLEAEVEKARQIIEDLLGLELGSGERALAYLETFSRHDSHETKKNAEVPPISAPGFQER